MELSWSLPTVGVVLEASPAVGSGAQWSLVAEPVTTTGGRAVVSVSPSTATRFFRLREVADGSGSALLSVLSASPAMGETGVAVTRETIFQLSGALASETTLTTNAVFAMANGRRVLSRVALGSDRRRVTLFYLETLPASAQVEVTFDGSGLFDETARPVDLDGDGVAGGIGRIVFQTLANAPLETAGVEGHVFASERNPDGSNRPLAGVTITVDGMEETLRTTTDATGFFRMTPCPAGRFFVHVDGRTAAGSQWPGGAYYPFVGKAWEASAGRTNNLAGGTGEIFLPYIQAEALRPVSSMLETKVTFTPSVVATNPAFAGVEVLVPANSLFADDGTRGGRVGIAPVSPDRLPEPLPPGLNLPLVITIQTDGPMNFDQPVPVKFPNLPDPVTGVKLPPGAKSAIWSFNHDTGTWEIQGPATVTADGNYLVSDPGSGIRQPGWHGSAPGSGGCGPDCDGDGDGDEPCDICPDDPPPKKPECKHWNPYCDDNPCKKDATLLANSIHDTIQDATVTLVGGTGSEAFDCGLGGGVSASRATRDCSLDLEACATSNPITNPILDGAIGTVLGCLPKVGSYLGLAWTTKSVILNAINLNECAKNNAAVHRVERHGDGVGLDGVAAGASSAGLLQRLVNVLNRQIAVIEASSNVVATLVGPRWAAADSPEGLPVYRRFFEALKLATATTSPGGSQVTAEERAALLDVPRPNGNSEADVDILLARIDAMRRYQFGAHTPEGDAFIRAMAHMDDLIQSRAEEGWETLNDGWFQALEMVTAFAEPAVGNAAYPGLSIPVSGPSRLSAPPATAHAFSFPAEPSYYAILDEQTGFARRGRLTDFGRLPPIILPPGRRFLVLYYHPDSDRSGAAVFRSAASGQRTRIPAAPLWPVTGPDADGDGLSDQVEFIVGTAAHRSDTDGDGVSDGAEVEQGTHPMDGQPLGLGVLVRRDTAGSASSVTTLDDLALVADGTGGLAVFQVKEPLNPVLLSRVPAGSSPVTAVAAAGGHAILTTNGGVRVLRLGDGRSPVEVGGVPTGVTPRALAASGRLGFAPGQEANADTVAVIQYEKPLLLGHVRLPDGVGSASQLAVQGDHLWTLAWSKTATLLSYRIVGDAIEPVGSIDLGAFSPTAGRSGPELAVSASRAYVGHSRGFRILDITTPAAPVELAPSGTVLLALRDLALNGAGHLLTSIGGNDLGIYGVGEDRSTNLLLTIRASSDVLGMALHRGYALLANSTDGLSVANYLAPDIGTVPPTVALQAWVSHPPDRQESGQLFSVTAAARDDVQVRDVEFYIDGVAVARSGGFPFQASIRAPAIIAEPATFELRAKATDTAGNTGWSAPLTIRLFPDLTPPRLLRVSPGNGAIVVRGSIRGVRAEFDSPMSLPSLAEHWRLIEAGPDGQFGTGDDRRVTEAPMEWETSTSTAFLEAPQLLTSGRYQASIAADAADPAGNRLGTVFTWAFSIPRAKALASDPADNHRVLAGTASRFSVFFDEVLEGASVDPGRLAVVGQGPDGVAETVDDAVWPGARVTLEGGGRVATLSFAVSLPNGTYRLRLLPGVRDVYGGDVETNLTARFTVASPVEWAVDRGGAWETATNWSTKARPAAGDLVLIDRPAGDYLVTLASDPTVSTLRSAEPMLINGRRVTVLGTARFDAALILSNAATFSQGVVDFNGGVTLVGNANKTFANTLARNRGLFDWQRGGLVLSGTGMIHNLPGGVLLINKAGPPADSSGFVDQLQQNPIRTRLWNEGTIQKSGGSEEIFFDGFGLLNTGSIEALAGTLELATSTTNNGLLSVAAGARVRMGSSRGGSLVQTDAGRILGAGEFVINASATIDGRYEVEGLTIVSNVPARFLAPMVTRSLQVPRAPSAALVRALELVRGGRVGEGGAELHRDVTGSGALQVMGPSVWSTRGGVSGTLTWRSEGGLAISNSGFLEDESRLENRSTLRVDPGGTLVVDDDALLENTVDGIVELADRSAIQVTRSTVDRRALARNLGTLRKLAGSDLASLNGAVVNDGLIEVGSGTLRLVNGQERHGGRFLVRSNATLRIEPLQQFLPNSRIEGDGLVLFSSNDTSGSPDRIAWIEGTYTATHTVVSNGVLALRQVASFSDLELGRAGTLEFDRDITIRDSLRMGQSSGFRSADGTTGWAITSSGNSVLAGASIGTGLHFRQTGQARVEGLGVRLVNATFENAQGATMNVVGPTNSAVTWSLMSGGFNGGFLNAGTLVYDAPANGQLDVATTNTGLVEIRRGTLRVSSQLAHLAGEIRLSGGNLELDRDLFNEVPPLTLLGGVLAGSGSIVFTNDTFQPRVLTNTAAVIRPGLPLGALEIADRYDQQSGGVLEIELAGLSAGVNHDQLAVRDRANLGGTLRLILKDGFMPEIGHEFVVMTFGNRSGAQFAAVEGTAIAPDRRLSVVYESRRVVVRCVVGP